MLMIYGRLLRVGECSCAAASSNLGAASVCVVVRPAYNLGAASRPVSCSAAHPRLNS